MKEESYYNAHSATMLANYKRLTDTEKLFLSEILGDEEWIEARAARLDLFFNGEYAPSGDEWEDACFAKTQMAIRDKVAKGTPWE